MKTEAIKNLEKIVVSAGIGKIAVALQNFEEKVLPAVMKDFAAIVGQKPAVRRAKRSISGFKIREGAIVGLTATLRGGRMVDFLAKLNKVILPRIRDFNGISKASIDAGGNLNIGVKEVVVFPEINSDEARVDFGIQVTVVPKAVKSRDEAIKMYKGLGVPFKKS